MKAVHRSRRLISVLFVFVAGTAAADEKAWVETARLPAPEAVQGAAAHGDDVYAIASRVVARYDRASGERLAVSEGEAKHLNSGFFFEGKLYCAHSNYPQQPERSEIMVLDCDTMKLTTFKEFGEGFGSLTWAVRRGDHWWCNFAHYGDANRQTVLIEYDCDWRPVGRWHYPPAVLNELGVMSISGGLWRGDEILATGHDKREVYHLRAPERGETLELLETRPSPFPGQAIAVDPQTNGLLGIDRADRAIVFAELRPTHSDSSD